jgi:hypothetical protein
MPAAPPVQRWARPAPEHRGVAPWMLVAVAGIAAIFVMAVGALVLLR